MAGLQISDHKAKVAAVVKPSTELHAFRGRGARWIQLKLHAFSRRGARESHSVGLRDVLKSSLEVSPLSCVGSPSFTGRKLLIPRYPKMGLH